MGKTAIELLKRAQWHLETNLAEYDNLPNRDDYPESIKELEAIISDIDVYLSSPPSERAKELVKQIMSLVAFGDFEEMVGPDLDVAARDIEAFGQGWISVKDKLPEIGQAVLAYRPTAPKHGDDAITNCIYTGEPNTSWEGVRHGFNRINHPTHWMPLPSAPEAQGEKNE